MLCIKNCPTIENTRSRETALSQRLEIPNSGSENGLGAGMATNRANIVNAPW